MGHHQKLLSFLIGTSILRQPPYIYINKKPDFYKTTPVDIWSQAERHDISIIKVDIFLHLIMVFENGFFDLIGGSKLACDLLIPSLATTSGAFSFFMNDGADNFGNDGTVDVFEVSVWVKALFPLIRESALMGSGQFSLGFVSVVFFTSWSSLPCFKHT